MRKFCCPLQEGFRPCAENACMWFDDWDEKCQTVNISNALEDLSDSIREMRLQDEEKGR